MDREIAGAVGWGELRGREDEAEEEERGGRVRAMALQSFLLNLWFALGLQAHAELKEGCKTPGEGGVGFTQLHAAARAPSPGEGDGPEDAAVTPTGGDDQARNATMSPVIHSRCAASLEEIRSMNTYGRAGVRGRLISSVLVPVLSLSHAQPCCLSSTSFPAEQKNPNFFQASLSGGLLPHV